MSYASQDAEAAQRICESLRAAGVEVWFDRKELVGGDAWDQKIRRQIGTCALFVPIISANTQARAEGYFRLEWRLADKRTELMGKSKAFLLPVCVDETRDADADVPDSFLTVQWTRLRDGVAPPAFSERVRKLLSPDTPMAAEVKVRSGVPATSPQPPRRSGGMLAAAALAAVAVGGSLYLALRSGSTDKSAAQHSTNPVSAQPETGPQAEARKLVAHAWEQLNKAGIGREELQLADSDCERAAALAPNDAEVWAAWSHVCTWYGYHNLDRSAKRRESARACAERALGLAPRSYEARLAQACFFVRGGREAALGNAPESVGAREAERVLEGLLQERPDEPRALHALAIQLRNTGRTDEALGRLERLAQNPRFAVTAWNEIGWLRFSWTMDYQGAIEAADRSIALGRIWGNLSLRVSLALQWEGDLDRARDNLALLPASALLTDQGVNLATVVYQWRHEPQNLRRVLQEFPRDWLSTARFVGPKRLIMGLAFSEEGRMEAARVEWRAALEMVEQRLAESSVDTRLLWDKAMLQFLMGEEVAGQATYRLFREYSGDRTPITAVDLSVLAKDWDRAIDLLEVESRGSKSSLTAAILRLNPTYDQLRDNPRFRALQARLDADPRFNPKAKSRSVAEPTLNEPRTPTKAR